MKINEIVLLQKMPPSKKEKQTMHIKISPLRGGLGGFALAPNILQECYRGYIKRQIERQVKRKFRTTSRHGYGFRHDSRKNLRK